MVERKSIKKLIVNLICVASLGGVALELHASRKARANSGHAAIDASAATHNFKVASSSLASASSGRQTHYGRLPMAFEPNVGQAPSDTKFLAHGNGYTVFLRPQDTTLVMRQRDGAAKVRMQMLGANSTAALAASEKLPGTSNYIIGNRPSEWKINTPNYRKVTEKSVYPGIDVVYYGSQRQLEYDFVVAPHANPRVIQIGFDGARGLQTDSEGDLLVSIGDSDLRLHKPVAYQQIDGENTPVSVQYVVKASREIALQVGKYDPSRQLIIDPVLSYSTYLGGSDIDGANAIAVASDNTAFIAGGTFSSDFPTAHALQPNQGGAPDFPQDAFVAKISADGSTLVYSTYLGGSGFDFGNGIAVDSFGQAYVTGTTDSPDFPITFGAWNPDCGGDAKCGATWNGQGLIVSNAFVSKLNVAGSGLIYSTFLGEYEYVRGQAIAVDSNQQAYVTGFVDGDIAPLITITPPKLGPPPFIPAGPPFYNVNLAATAFQPSYGGGTSNAYVAKFSASGNSLLYLSYLGGATEDVGYGIAADDNGFAYITGLTYSTDFPTLAPLQAAAGGAGDAFVTKVNTNASGAGSLVFSTYVGGVGLDQGNAVALDSQNGGGNIYVAGTTSSSALGVVANGFSTTNKGQGDAFALKLTNGGALTYLSFLGGSLADAGIGIAADASGNAYVTGSTVSTDFPIVGTVFQSKFGGGNADAFVTKINPTGTALLYSTYLGGTNTDVGNGIAVDTNGSAYVAGQTCSTDFPLANPLRPGPNGNCDAFVSKVSTIGGIALNPAGLVFAAQSIGVNSASQSITITNTNDSASVAISGITIAGDFSQTNTCPASLSAGAQCTVSVIFHPTAAGIRKGTLSIADNAPGSPQVANLTGSTSTLSLSASSLTFGNQTVGVSSTAQSVTLSNIGTTALTISTISASGDFTQANSCGSSLPAGTNCVINVTYKPTAPGQSIGAVTISDSAPGSPQSILLAGTAVGQSTDFTLAALPPSASVPAGTPASFTLTIAPVGGFSQPISFSCGNLPRGASCSFSANPATMGGTGSTAVTLSVATALRTFAPPVPANRRNPPAGLLGRFSPIWLGAMLLALIAAILANPRRHPTLAMLGFAAVLLIAAAGCGSGNQSGVPAGTPAGNYQVTVTATSGTLTHTATLSLQVN